eukprot:gene6544-7283_t
MKCWNCKTDVLDLFSFCHSCGRSLKRQEQHDETGFELLAASSGSSSEDNRPVRPIPKQYHSAQTSQFNSDYRSSTPIAAGPTKPTRPNTGTRSTFETFEQFRKRLSNDRSKSINNKKKKKAAEPKDTNVLINVGVMYHANGNILKPIKGKNMSIRVPITIRKVELLSKVTDKHVDHDRHFHRYGDYALVYPDGTEVLTLPGKPTTLFQLDKYKEEIGKPWNRINLYIVDRASLELCNMPDEEQFETDPDIIRNAKNIQESNGPGFKIGHQGSISDHGHETASNVHNQGSRSGQENSGDNSSNLSAVSNLVIAGSQSSTSISSNANLNILKDMFPAKKENELNNALQSHDSLEEAINFLLQVSNASVTAYANLMDEMETIENEPDESFSCIDISDPDDQPSTYSSNEEIQKKLFDLKTSALNPNQYFPLKVTRSNVWQDTLFKLSRVKECELKNSLKVHFVGEPAVDRGGPSRELCSLLNHAVQGRLVTDGVFRHDVLLLKKKEYFAFGQLTAIGLLQGSPGPKFFQKSVVDYILYNNVESVTPTIEEIPDESIRRCLIELDKVENGQEFKNKASFECGFRFDAGYCKPIIELKDKEDFFQSISLHFTLLSSIKETDQFIEGLRVCNVLNTIWGDPELFRCVLQKSKHCSLPKQLMIFFSLNLVHGEATNIHLKRR